MLGVGDIADELLTVAGIRPQVLRLPVLVARDDGVGCTQDGLRRPVVLLEQDHSRPWKVRLEVVDIADGRAAEGVDRLIRVTHHHELRWFDGHIWIAWGIDRTELPDQDVLSMVCVLVLINEDMPESAAILLAELRKSLEQVHCRHDQVVEVQRVGRDQPPLIFPVRLGVALLDGRARPGGCRFMIDELVLASRHPIHDRAHRETLRIKIKIVSHQLHQPLGIGIVVDRERPRHIESADLGSQDPNAGE